MPLAPATRICAALLVLGVAVTGCESLNIETRESTAVRNTDRADRDKVSPTRENSRTDRTIFGDGLDLFGGGDDQAEAGANLPVNKYLWRGAIETLNFLPLNSTDPHGGVIVTDWGATADAPDERFKVTAYITSATLKPQSLNVVVNRQKLSPAGAWVTAPVTAEAKRQLEDAILTKARQLRTADSRAGRG